MSNAPAAIRYASNLLVLIGSFLLMMSAGEFYIAPIGQATAVLIGTILMLVSFIGLRMMKKWSIYIFSGLILISVASCCIKISHGQNVTSEQLALGSIIPTIYYSVVILCWSEFE